MTAHHLALWTSIVSTAAALAAPPRVVETIPRQGAADVEPGEMEIVVKFDAAVKMNSWSIVAVEDGTMPELLDDGPPAFRDNRTCVIKVKLEPGTKYAIGFNSATRTGFKSADDGTPAEPYALSFTTAAAKARTEKAPGEAKAPAAASPRASEVRVRNAYRKGDRGRIAQTTSLDLRINSSTGQKASLASRRSIAAIDEVDQVDRGLPVGVRRRVEKYAVEATNTIGGEQTRAPDLDGPVTVRIDRSDSPAEVTVLEGDAPESLLQMLAEDTFLDFAPAEPVKVGGTYSPPRETLAKVREAFGESDTLELTLKCRKIGTSDVPSGADDAKGSQGGRSAPLRLLVAEFDLTWKQAGKMENGLPFSLTGRGEVVYAADAGILLKLAARGEIKLEPTQVPDGNGGVATLSGGGKYVTEYTFAPIGLKRGLGEPASPEPGAEPDPRPVVAREADAAPPGPRTEAPAARTERADSPPKELPGDWTTINDDLFGTQVAVPPGWTPRVRGDVAYCVEPDKVARAGAFFMPMLLKGKAAPEEVADGFDAMLKRGLPDLQSATAGKPASECVQRRIEATIGGTPVTGEYRAVVGRSGTALVMGYLAPRDQVDALRPDFHRILGSYRYRGSRTRMQPFKSAAVELRIPAGWQVQTSEANGTANQDIDWQVSPPSAPGVRAFMVSPKFFTPNWITDVMTGQIDPQLLVPWRNRGFQPANFTSNEEALDAAVAAVLPGLEVVRKQSLDEVRDAFARMMQAAIAGTQMAGGDLQLNVVEYVGYRQVQGVRLKCVATVGMGTIIAQGSFNRTLAIWMTGIRGFEAPVAVFAEHAPVLERITSSFTYTDWWIREVMKANDEQARTLRKFYADMNRMDKEIFDSHVQTRSAISEMMYDTLTENNGYVNEKTQTVEKIPVDQVERFRNASGDLVSPEDVIDRHIPVNDATRLRAAGADDYMAFDRRVQVWL